MADFTPFEAKMRKDGQPELAIAAFADAYAQLAAGATGLIPESDLTPVDALPTLTDLAPYRARGEADLDRLVVIKLNGGLGTTMGLERAKSLLPVRGQRRFIDLIADQVVDLRGRFSARLPLVTMDSFRTQADVREALAGHAVTMQDIAASFLQHRVPKVLVHDLSPATHEDEDLTWCPPGHGDLYLALMTSGLLDALLDSGLTHAFVSNADNLGATPSPEVFGWMLDKELPFIMECATRSAADMKGGHLARGPRGQLLLREVAQCPDSDLPAFQDIGYHRFFNTNNLWVDLRLVRELIASRKGVLGLPLIRNKKPLDPARPVGVGATSVYQLETAMGSAISLFAGAAAVEVGRDRFLPVKSTNDLLVMMSDVYALGDDSRLMAQARPPIVDLDPRYYRTLEGFEARFDLDAPPSLREASRFVVRGDVRFGPGVVVRGEVELSHTGEAPLVLREVTLTSA
jgi:UTP--glucose-1-phosphate uridylyltransferase